MLCGTNIFSIFLGDAKAMSLKALYANTLNPLDLTSCTEISMSLPNADGTFSVLTLGHGDIAITGDPKLGSFTASAAAIGGISDDLNVGELQTFNVTFTIASNPLTVPYINALSVFQ